MSQPVDSVSVEIVYDTSQSLNRLRSAVDSALRSVTSEFNRAFDAIERHADGAGDDIGREIAAGGEVAEGAIREVERQARTSFNRVSREATEAGASIEGRLGKALKAISFAAAGAAVVAGLTLMTSAGLKAAASLEQTQVAFSSLLGSAEEGKRVFDGLKEFAARTPFELGDITGAAQRFLAFNDAVGIADAQLQPFLTTLGDIASVTASGADGVNRVTLALGQIASRGKVSLEELLQISEALPGFNSVAAIAAQQGISTAEALEKISAGEISATEGIGALLEGMKKFPGAAGAMAAQSQTLLGVFSTFKDTIGQSLAGAFEPIIPSLKQTLTDITPVLGAALGEIAPQVGSVLIDLLAAIGPAIKPLASILATTLDALSPFVELAGQILQPVLEALVPVFDALAPVIKELAVPIQDLVVALLPIIPALADILVAVITVAAPLLKLVSIIVSFLAQKAIAPLVTLLAEGLGFLAEAVRQFGVWLTTVDWGAVLGAIGSFFADLAEDISEFFKGIGEWLFSLPKMAADAFVAFNKAVLEKIREFIGFMNALPGRVLKALGDFGKLLLNKGKDLIRGLWDGIKAMGGWLWDHVKGFVNDFIIEPFTTVLRIHSPSKVMADRVGQWIPAGVEQGAESGMSSLRGLIDSMLTIPTGGEGGGGTNIVFGPGSVILQFSGGVLPTTEQAKAIGEAAAGGLTRALARRAISSAVRQQ